MDNVSHLPEVQVPGEASVREGLHNLGRQVIMQLPTGFLDRCPGCWRSLLTALRMRAYTQPMPVHQIGAS